MGARRAVHGINAIVFILVVLGIFVILNFLANRSAPRYDLTENKLHSLSDQTRRVLEGLKDGVRVIAFFKEKDVVVDRKQFIELIEQYRRVSSKIEVEFVDPDKNPGLAKKYDIREYATCVLISGEKDIKLKLGNPISPGILSTSEQLITNAIIKLSKDVTKTVYFLTGHGERDIYDNVGPTGFGKARKALEDESYMPRELMLMREGVIEVENTMLVVAAPGKDLLKKELDSIKAYLESGGMALFIVEPRSGAQLVSLLKNFSITLNNDVVIDPSSKLVGGGDVAPIIATYGVSDITEDFRFATIFPYTRSLKVDNSGEISPLVLALTSEYAWSETNLSLFEEGDAELGPEDPRGPLGVAAIAEIGEEGRIAVFGSADFISNRWFDFSGNSDLFMNTVNWLSRDEDLISIRPKKAKAGKLTMTPGQFRFMFALTIVIIPAAVLFGGFYMWIRRRNM
ncbi:MAG: GldG family protein [Thermodesulfobacteriota bacterium]